MGKQAKWEATRRWEGYIGRQWQVKRRNEYAYHRDKLRRIIYFKTPEAAGKRARELNKKEKEL